MDQRPSKLRDAGFTKLADKLDGLADKQPKVVVKTVKGEAAAERLIKRMMASGYELDQSTTRKVVWSPATGLFTRKQKHTLTFIKR